MHASRLTADTAEVKVHVANKEIKPKLNFEETCRGKGEFWCQSRSRGGDSLHNRV